MNVLEAIILGIIQGLTEFIPVSSTAHLTIAGMLMGLVNSQDPEKWTAFIAVIQLGTLAAVLLYFKSELRSVPFNFIKENFTKSRKPIKEQSRDSFLGWQIIIATIPIVTIGLLLKKIIEGNLTKSPTVIASSLIILAIILLIAEKSAKFKKDMDELTIKDAFIIGLAQCLALIPGSSRSGTTITAGLFLGMKRDTAAKFSFLLSIPAVLASGLLEFYQSLKYINGSDALALIIATIISAIFGYLSIAFLLKYLKKNSTMLFIVYRIAAGAILFFMIARGLI